MAMAMVQVDVTWEGVDDRVVTVTEGLLVPLTWFSSVDEVPAAALDAALQLALDEEDYEAAAEIRDFKLGVDASR